MNAIEPFEPKSDTRTAWQAIDDRAMNSKKKVRSGPWKSKTFRFPEERPPAMSAKTIARKVESARRIAEIKKTAAKYKFLAENDSARVIYKNGVELQAKLNGRFVSLKNLF